MEQERTWGGLTGSERESRRREQLLAAALECFGKQGWAETRIVDISRTAGLSQRYFYEHFEDREACFGAVLDQLAGEVQEIVRAAVTEPGTADERAQATLTHLVHFFTVDQRRLRVAFVESFATAPLRARRAALLASFATLASRLMRSLHPTPERADQQSLELSALVLSGGMAEALVEYAEGSLAVSAERLVAQLLGLYRQAAALATGSPPADA